MKSSKMSANNYKRPIIAAFASNGYIRKLKEGDTDFKNYFRIDELFKANKIANTTLYFFSIHDVDFKNKRINGIYYDEQRKRWRQKYFPYPDVLYDRGGGYLASQKAINERIRNELDRMNVLKINPLYTFNKYDLFEKLKKFPAMRQYLPHTIHFNREEDLKEMLKISKTVYIKDVTGSNGKGVMRVRKLPNNRYEYSYNNVEGLTKRTVSSRKALMKAIDSYFSSKTKIIQSAIELLEINDRLIDMRATLQRNKDGRLEINSIPVRIGNTNSPITTSRTGSSTYTFEEFFKKVLYYSILPNSEFEIHRLKRKIQHFLIQVYTHVERVYGEFGEIGIDFAIDKNGKVWLIECNAKPGKDTLYNCYGRETIDQAFLNPLEYGKWKYRTSRLRATNK